MAWHNWYHITLTAYGQWLPGDPRGWRTRDHRQHVEGDYKHPPEPTNRAARLHESARDSLRFDPVVFPETQRQSIGERVLQSLAIQRIEVTSLGVPPKHVHILACCPRDNPKIVAGKCKQNVSRNLAPPSGGGWWAADSHAEPIVVEAHFWRAFLYILDHREEGAWVWFDESLPF